jgi:hypothetical protein
VLRPPTFHSKTGYRPIQKVSFNISSCVWVSWYSSNRNNSVRGVRWWQQEYCHVYNERFIYDIVLNLPDHPSLLNLPDHPSLLNLPDHPSLPNLPDHPSLFNLPDHSSLLNLPDHSSLLNLPDHSSLHNLPDHSSLLNLPDHPSSPLILMVLLLLVFYFDVQCFVDHFMSFCRLSFFSGGTRLTATD